MKEFVIESPFRLSTGGLFYRLLHRWRLVDENRYVPWRRILLFTGLTWLPLLVITTIDGSLFGANIDIPFCNDPVPHVRYLIALPLLFIADRIIDPSVAYAVRHFQICDLVPDDSDPHFQHSVEKLIRQRDAAWVDVALMGIAIILVWAVIFKFGHFGPSVNSSSWIFAESGGHKVLTPAGWWLALVSSPFMLFVLLRWIWRMVIWIRFLNRMSHIRLSLQATHPDQMGGLGLLPRAQLSFGMVFSAIGAMMSSALANDIINAGRGLAEFKWEIMGFVLVSFTIITTPLCTFFSQLLETKQRDLGRYNSLAYGLSKAFQSRWLKDKKVDEQGKTLITATDPSAIADFSAVYDKASNLRLIPLRKRQVVGLIIILVAPFVPLVFTQISIKEVLNRMAQLVV